MTNMPIRDVSLFVKVIGQGYPLVLMHGGPGLDHTTLLPLLPLADQFTLIFYDHRCNGHSEGVDGDGPAQRDQGAYPGYGRALRLPVSTGAPGYHCG